MAECATEAQADTLTYVSVCLSVCNLRQTDGQTNKEVAAAAAVRT